MGFSCLRFDGVGVGWLLRGVGAVGMGMGMAGGWVDDSFRGGGVWKCSAVAMAMANLVTIGEIVFRSHHNV